MIVRLSAIGISLWIGILFPHSISAAEDVAKLCHNSSLTYDDERLRAGRKELADYPDRACLVRRDETGNHYASFQDITHNWCALTPSARVIDTENHGEELCSLTEGGSLLGLLRARDRSEGSKVARINLNFENGTTTTTFVDAHGPCVQGACDTALIKGENIVRLTTVAPATLIEVDEELVQYLSPDITSISLNGKPTNALDVQLGGNALTISLRGSEPVFGALRVNFTDRFALQRTSLVKLARPAFVDDNPTVLGLRLELALARKVVADEMYMLSPPTAPRRGECQPENACEVEQKYEEALKVLPQCAEEADDCSSLTSDQLATIKLVRADIAYRTQLLREGLPFLGGYRALKPTTPHQELIKLKAILQRINETADRLERWQFRATDKELIDLENEAQRIFAMSENDSQQKKARIERIRSSNFDASIAKYEARKDYLQKQMVYINSRAANISAQQDGLTTQAGQLVESGIAAATGVPVTEIEALASGDLVGAIEGYALNELETEAGRYLEEFAANNEFIAEAYGEFREKEAEIQKLVDDAESYKRQIDSFTADFDSALTKALTQADELGRRLGADIVGQFNAEQRRALDEIYRATQPIGELATNAHRMLQESIEAPREWIEFNKALLETTAESELERAYGSLAEARTQISANLEQLVSAGTANLDQLRAMILADLEDGSKSPRSVHEYVVRIFPDFFEVPGIRNAIEKVRVEDRENVRVALASIKMNNRFVSFDDKHMIINPESGRRTTTIDYELLLRKLVREHTPNLPIAEVKEIVSTASFVREKTIIFFSAASQGLPQMLGRLDRELRKDRSKLSNAWEAISEFVPDDAIRETKARMVSSIALKPPKEAAKTSTPQPNSPSVVDQGTGISPEANAAMSAALNAAFPGAGIALQLGQTWAAMDANRELLESLDQQMIQAMAEYNHVISTIDQSNVNSVVAKLEAERALALADAARAQVSQYNFAMDLAHDEIKRMEQRLRLYRPYFFYNAELLRERFDAFDRSLSIWTSGRPETGFFAQQIQNDPRNTRLALDTEIHLFGWLNREREATKTDPFHLLNHWQQLIALAEDYCADYGCKPGSGSLGKLGATVPLRLLRDLAGSDVAADFGEWQSSDDRSLGFTFPLTITSAHKVVPPEYLNVRLLDFNIVALDRFGNALRGNVVKVQHSGYAKIPYKDDENRLALADEQLLPTQQMPPSNAIPFDLTQLAGRFQSQVDQISLLPLRGFEGYGLYGTLDVTIVDSQISNQISDFEVQVAYIYQESGDILDEGDVVARLDEDDVCSSSESPVITKELVVTPPESYCRASLRIVTKQRDSRGNCVGDESVRRIDDPVLIEAWMNIDSMQRAYTTTVGTSNYPDVDCLVVEPRVTQVSVGRD